jgi:hypothetical protein
VAARSLPSFCDDDDYYNEHLTVRRTHLNLTHGVECLHDGWLLSRAVVLQETVTPVLDQTIDDGKVQPLP